MNENLYKKDMVVFWQGDASDCMYHIKWGKVGVFADYATSRQRKLAELSSGDYFGEMGLIDHAPRSATVVVLERGTILNRIGEEEFAEYLTENPNKVDEIIRQLSHKLRQATRDYLELCRYVSEKVGKDTREVDETSNYQFGSSEQLRAVHDERAEQLRDA